MCRWAKQQVLSRGPQDCGGGGRDSVRQVGGTWALTGGQELSRCARVDGTVCPTALSGLRGACGNLGSRWRIGGAGLGEMGRGKGKRAGEGAAGRLGLSC